MSEEHKPLAGRPIPTAILPYPDLSREDEISLIDLWLILVRHKRLIAGIFGTVVALGVIVALMKTPLYTYTTSIQIARSSDGLIEQPVTVLAMLNKSYIPFALKQINDTQPDEKQIMVEATIPKDSQIIVMESKGGGDDQATHIKIHRQILDRLAQEHDPVTNVVKLTMENDLNRIRNQLDRLKDEGVSLQAQGIRLDEQESLLKAQLKDTQKLIDSSESNRNKAVKEVEGEAKAMTLMLIDNETQKYQSRAGEIKERLQIGLSAERDKLKNALADNLRGQNELQEKQREIQAKIVNIRYTRSIVPTLRSLAPQGAGKSVIVALAGILGLMLGVFAAFLAEFRLKVREKLNGQPSDQAVNRVENQEPGAAYKSRS